MGGVVVARRVVARVVVAVAGTVAVGVAVNQVLNGGVWNWWALGVSATVAVTFESVTRWLDHREEALAAPALPPVSPRRLQMVTLDGVSRGALASDYGLIARVTPAVPLEEVKARPGLKNVPVQTREFVGRDRDMADLENALTGPGPVVVAVVHGLGGVGKSTLAARYAISQALEQRSSPVWWITAEGPSEIQNGLASLAVALQSEVAGMELEELADRAVLWLDSHNDWLLVLDNVADPSHIAPLLARVGSGQAPTGNGSRRIIVTSRLAEGWARIGAQELRLDVLSEQQAVDLLFRIARPVHVAEDWEGVEELVRELGCLPLAIDQAAAYLHQMKRTPRAYLESLAGNSSSMYGKVAEGADAQRTIARVWRITLDQLTDEFPLTGHLLRMLAWWAPEAIPLTLLDPVTKTMPNQPMPAGPVSSRIWRLGMGLIRTGERMGDWADSRGTTFNWSIVSALTDALGLETALGKLAAFNMITLGRDTVTVHRLVQAVARTPDPQDPNRAAADIDKARAQATRLMIYALPGNVDDPATWPVMRTVFPHIDALNNHTSADTESIGLLCNRVGNFLRGQGAHNRAITYLNRSLTITERLHGPHHDEALTTRSNIALAHQEAGDYQRALPMLQQVLDESSQQRGSAHEATLACLNNLALAYQDVGDHERAIPLFEQAVAGSVNEDHSNTLIFRANLASSYQTVGDERAIPLAEQNLAEAVQRLGGDNVITLSCQIILGMLYESAGDYGRAIPLQEQNHADCARVLGSDHPLSLASCRSLASSLHAFGDYTRAASLQEQNHADYQRVLGRDHPLALIACNNLARSYESTGDLGRAVHLYEQTLTDSLRVLGENHRITVKVRSNLERVQTA
ncbi:FxSxx-COOH system tetratricopeptide repeat protein [Acrocarpospora catenulata]|uniref:FxSxx-COOH system tetratricopeptide repeat protein n=1 Tax=Acrocarpospora catenulata TaxID=2836182 RepID=UPI001BD93048|nr:FxSxx-COOH system tetratricopeptide repeat protein [Acrocarpospora catenulata]